VQGYELHTVDAFTYSNPSRDPPRGKPGWEGRSDAWPGLSTKSARNLHMKLTLLRAQFTDEMDLRCVWRPADTTWRTAASAPLEAYLSIQSAAHRDKSQEWNVSKQKWNLC